MDIFKKQFVAAVTFLVIVGAGVWLIFNNQPESVAPTELEPAEEQEEVMPTATSSTPEAETTTEPVAPQPYSLQPQPQPAPQPTPSPESPPQLEPAPAPEQGVQEFQILANDNGFYIDDKDISSITVSSGNQIKIAFQVSTQNVYYGGLRFAGCGDEIPSLAPGASAPFEFIATASCTITSYWPATGVVKAHMQVMVE